MDREIGLGLDDQSIAEVVHGPNRPPVHPPQDSMGPVLFCSWDLYHHEKWMPPSPKWDGLSV